MTDRTEVLMVVGALATVPALVSYGLLRLARWKARRDWDRAEVARWTDEMRRADEVTRKEMGFKDDPFQWEARTPREKLLADALRAQQTALGQRRHTQKASER